MRIAGITLPDEKHLEISLTYIFGIGRTTAQKICDDLKIARSKKVKDLTEDEDAKVTKFITDNFKIEGDRRREVAGDIKRLKEIGCYRGQRHIRNLPVRGQSSKRNARGQKGPIKAAIANKKKA